jgi:L-fuconolactonase
VTAEPRVVDAHVHYWDPGALEYPWLEALPALRRRYGPEEYRAATAEVPVEGIVFVEANPRPDRGAEEARRVAELAAEAPGVRAIVAYADLTTAARARAAALDALQEIPLVRGIRHNVQGEPPGFALQPAFVEGVREVGRRGLVFDLCATHDQLPELLELVDRCPDTRFVLDHCAKPAIRDRREDPWRDDLARLAERERIWCKLSGLTTEAASGWTADDLRPYAEHAVSCFGPSRLIYGSDWPVLTLACSPGAWYHFTRSLTDAWSDLEREAFYRGNAQRVYGGG